MALIHVPKPPKSAYNPERPAGSLLMSQVEHLREAESKLPLKYRSEIYVRAIRTEGEAARYIREVTEAIHEAHDDAARARARRAPKRKVISIAAVADEGTQRKTRKKGTKTVAKKRKT
jgi:hypothetical protein